MEQLKDEYKSDEIEDAFDERAVPHQLDFLYEGDSENFIQACNFSEDKNEFVLFLRSGTGQNVKTNNSLLIHIESGDIFL